MNERTQNTDEARFGDKAKRLFDQSVEELDAATLSRLNRGRHAALAELERPGRRYLQWAPAAGVAAAAVLAVVIWTGNVTTDDVVETSVAADIEILLTEDELEMIEDLEFYSWIDLDDTDSGMEPANNVG